MADCLPERANGPEDQAVEFGVDVKDVGVVRARDHEDVARAYGRGRHEGDDLGVFVHDHRIGSMRSDEAEDA